jgi:hypothetical protein
MPANPRRSPEPIVNHRTIEINRLDDIVGTIDVFITHDLYGNGLGSRIFLHKDRSYILVDILCQNRLDYHEMLIILSRFDDT